MNLSANMKIQVRASFLSATIFDSKSGNKLISDILQVLLVLVQAYNFIHLLA